MAQLANATVVYSRDLGSNLSTDKKIFSYSVRATLNQSLLGVNS
jgi:hypothetical protein